MVTEEGEPAPHLLFTAPWDPLVVRRGDALGLRALTDVFADALAPDLSNRIHDGRWVTILSWCLVRSHAVFQAAGGRSLVTRAEQQARYAWLRPLELLWVARTIRLAETTKGRSLAGQRRVRLWLDGEQRAERFGMSVDQFRAYRQTGMYGGYRLAFRRWPGMTVGRDGWTPGPSVLALAKWLDEKLKAAQPPWRLHPDADEAGISAASARKGIGKEDEWWLRKWQTVFERGPRADEDTLPQGRDDISKLPEAKLLLPVLFGDHPAGQRRAHVARAAGLSSAEQHLDLCRHLATAFKADPTIALLPTFSRLADAGMAAMNVVATAVRARGRVELQQVAALADARPRCKELADAALAWRRVSPPDLQHIQTAHRFAAAITSGEPAACLRALLEHHEAYGGGLRWFVLRKGVVEPRTALHPGSSLYRFRLWALCRLAVQCGLIADMPQAVLESREEDEEEAGDE